MADRYQGKVAFVTGAASGLGREIASSLAARGALLVVCDVQADLLDAAARELKAAGATVLKIAFDVSDRQAFYDAADQAEAHFGHIDYFFNNAGVGHVGVPLDEVPDETLSWLVGVNVVGVLNGIKALVPKLKRSGQSGHIVNTSSMAALAHAPGWSQGLYSATKMAVLALSLDLREAMAPHGIGVSAFCPGLVATKIAETAERLQPDANRSVTARVPRELIDGAMPVEEAVDILLAGVERNRPIIITHPEMWPAVAAFHETIRQAYEDFPSATR
jgi:NAD(P)-dependent dehydrogenase (short-subunit alcohol dehydrogenase family)